MQAAYPATTTIYHDFPPLAQQQPCQNNSPFITLKYGPKNSHKLPPSSGGGDAERMDIKPGLPDVSLHRDDNPQGAHEHPSREDLGKDFGIANVRRTSPPRITAQDLTSEQDLWPLSASHVRSRRPRIESSEAVRLLPMDTQPATPHTHPHRQFLKHVSELRGFPSQLLPRISDGTDPASAGKAFREKKAFEEKRTSNSQPVGIYSSTSSRSTPGNTAGTHTQGSRINRNESRMKELEDNMEGLDKATVPVQDMRRAIYTGTEAGVQAILTAVEDVALPPMEIPDTEDDTEWSASDQSEQAFEWKAIETVKTIGAKSPGPSPEFKDARPETTPLRWQKLETPDTKSLRSGNEEAFEGTSKAAMPGQAAQKEGNEGTLVTYGSSPPLSPITTPASVKGTRTGLRSASKRNPSGPAYYDPDETESDEDWMFRKGNKKWRSGR